mmetsp:Transcript_3674/g.5530  ORF Transcript_3674/g.5530 Transcript_3674/m.5530 type:complete len:92 (-) Transcript_3674:171-446(-)
MISRAAQEEERANRIESIVVRTLDRRMNSSEEKNQLNNSEDTRPRQLVDYLLEKERDLLEIQNMKWALATDELPSLNHSSYIRRFEEYNTQ